MSNTRSKVKSHIRSGRIVKSHDRKTDRVRKNKVLSKIGFSLLGITGLTGLSVGVLKFKHLNGIRSAANTVKNSNLNLTKINNNQPIIYTVSGLRNDPSDYMGRVTKELFPKANIISLPLTFNVGKNTNFSDAIKKYIKPLLDKGYNPDSLELAKNIYHQSKLNPTNNIYLVGHSAGSVTTNHAQEILNRLGVKTKVVNTGGYYSKLEKLSKKNNFTILGKKDNVVKSFYSHNPILIDGGHNPYSKTEWVEDKDGVYVPLKNKVAEQYKQWAKQMRMLIK